MIMIDWFNAAWLKFAAIAAGVSLLVGFCTNLGKIKSWIKRILEDHKKRKSAPAQTLALMKSMQINVQRLEGNMTNVITKVNTLEDHVITINKQVHDIQKETTEQSQMLTNLDADTADLLSVQLTKQHDYYVKKGSCSTQDKQRIGKIYDRYKSRGRNHISDHLMDDILALPPS